MGVTIVMLLILAVVVGGGLWTVKALKPKRDEDVITVEPEPTPYQKTGTGTALAIVKQTKPRYESESPIDPGQAVAQIPQHKIVRTWITTGQSYPHYNWLCCCGVADYGISMDQGARESKKHCREYTRAEVLKAQSNGRFSW